MPKVVDIVNNKPVPTGEEIVEQIHAVMHLFRGRQHEASRGTDGAVSHLESKVIGHFLRHPGDTPSEFAARIGRDKGQVTRLITGLRERGLLEARTDEADRRLMRLHVTAEGQAALDAVRRRARRLAAEAMDGLGDAERQALGALLGRIRSNLESGAPGA